MIPPNASLETPLKNVRARMRAVQRARGLTLAATIAIGGLLVLTIQGDRQFR